MSNVKDLEYLLLYVVEEVTDENKTKVFVIAKTKTDAEYIKNSLELVSGKKFIIKQKALKDIEFLN